MNVGRVHVAAVGNICVDVLLEVDGLPRYSGDHRALRQGAKLSSAGSLNCLIACIRLGASVAPVGFVDSPDKDLLTAFILQSAASLGFVCDGMVPMDGYRTPSCAVLVEPNGSHTFLASNEKGANNLGALDPRRVLLTDPMRRILWTAEHVVVDGYSAAGDPDVVNSALSIMKSPTEKPFLWVDPQALACDLASYPILESALRNARGVSLTLQEARALTCRAEATGMDVLRHMARDRVPSATIILLKLGERGCFVGRRPCADSDSWTIRHVPGFHIGADAVLDTTGCGDAFLGSFLAGITVLNLSVADACILANATGAATGKRMGTGRDGIADIPGISNILQTTKEGVRLLADDAVRAAVVSKTIRGSCP
jgi:sugar/nucleoside kinase (ribokinase family)